MAEAGGTVPLIRFPAGTVKAQIGSILAAWGMPADLVAITAEAMLESDLAGIDSHGIAMLPLYETHQAAGHVTMTPEIRIVRDGPATGLVDGGGGMGHPPSRLAMTRAIDKARAYGVGIVAVRNSYHFGAAGVYAAMAAEQGLIGIALTPGLNPSVVPTRAAVAMFGTNPIACAAPARRNPPFLLDMATSTVAIGKLTLADFNAKPIPEGWALDGEGNPTRDPKVALKTRLLTPVGGTPAMSSHKGYGLAAMVEILSSFLPGGAWAPRRERRQAAGAKLYNVGHLFIAIDPAAFREPGAFEDDVDDMIDALRAARAVAPDQPVLVHGDPERAARADRLANGVPMPATLIARLADIAGRAGASFHLEVR